MLAIISMSFIVTVKSKPTETSFPSNQKTQIISAHTRTKFIIRQNRLGIQP